MAIKMTRDREAVREVLRHTEQRHGSHRRNQDHAVEDKVPKTQDSAQMGSRIRRGWFEGLSHGVLGRPAPRSPTAAIRPILLSPDVTP